MFCQRADILKVRCSKPFFFTFFMFLFSKHQFTALSSTVVASLFCTVDNKRCRCKIWCTCSGLAGDSILLWYYTSFTVKLLPTCRQHHNTFIQRHAIQLERGGGGQGLDSHTDDTENAIHLLFLHFQW